MISKSIIAAAAASLLLYQSHSQSALAFAPTSLSHHVKAKTTSFSLSSTADEVQQLLEKARQLREEAAALSGQSVEQMEQEAEQKKKITVEQRAVVEKAREERESKSRRNLQVLPVPENAQAQVQQAAAAVERAFKDGIVRQTVRFALIGEEEPMSGDQNEWPGGVKQMYREAGKPLTEALLKDIRAFRDNGVSTRIPLVTSYDIWDFDGSAIVKAKHAEGVGDALALVFPNTDSKYLKDIEMYDKEAGSDNLFLLINPFWRNADSWSFNILQPNAKKKAEDVIFSNGFDVTYAVLRFSARGEDCVALKSYPNAWQMYAYREDPSWFNQEVPILLGSSDEEPTSSQFTELLNSRPEFKFSKNMRQMQRMMGNEDQ